MIKHKGWVRGLRGCVLSGSVCVGVFCSSFFCLMCPAPVSPASLVERSTPGDWGNSINRDLLICLAQLVCTKFREGQVGLGFFVCCFVFENRLTFFKCFHCYSFLIYLCQRQANEKEFFWVVYHAIKYITGFHYKYINTLCAVNHKCVNAHFYL